MRRRTAAVCLGVAAAMQIVAVIGPSHPMIGVALAIIAGLCVGWVWTRKVSTHWEMLLVTGTLGGAAMLLGSFIDAQQVDTGAVVLPPCHASEASVPSSFAFSGLVAGLGSWMTLLMLAVCVPACLMLCESCGPTAGRALRTHGVCTLTMLIGMFTGGSLLSPWVQPLGLGALGTAHVAMTIGMLFGTAFGSIVVDFIIDRPKPR